MSRTRASVANQLIGAASQLADDVDTLSFTAPVTHCYNPLRYAWKAHRQYLQRAPKTAGGTLFLGMNPGPWGMAQSGVPFGEIDAVREWIGIQAKTDKPALEHPQRPIEGFDCGRSEVSGRRLWGLFRERFGCPDEFFAHHFVANYCPLVFMESSGRNRTPDKLPAAEREPLNRACDQHLRQILNSLRPRFAIGIGAYAEKCLQRVAATIDLPPTVARVLHPSPASPAANRDWAGTATQQLIDAGVWG